MIRRLLLTVLWMLAFTTTVRADALGYSKERPLLFGIDADYPPMEFLDSEGVPHGYDIEFTRELMRRLDIPYV